MELPTSPPFVELPTSPLLVELLINLQRAERHVVQLINLLPAEPPTSPLPVGLLISPLPAVQPAALQIRSKTVYVPAGCRSAGTFSKKETERVEYFAFQWHITEACDQRCKHCYIYALGSHAQFQEMRLADMTTVLENIHDFCRKANRLPYLYITGGDPILHPDFWPLLKILKTAGIPFTIMGNPFHLTDEACRKMKECGCRKYQLSLDGLRETHDKIRKPGSYDATIEAIATLQRAGLHAAIMATVSKWNVQEIPALVDEVVAANADIFAFSRYCPSIEDRDTCCSPQEYRDMLDRCWKKFQQYEGSNTWFSLKDHLWTLYKYENGLFDPNAYPEPYTIYDGCNCGNGHLTILSDGAVYACRRMESKVGNALTDDLYELFTGPEFDAYREYEKFEKCAGCELLRFCRGCPAVAAGYHGSMYAPDPECWKVIGNENGCWRQNNY